MGMAAILVMWPRPFEKNFRSRVLRSLHLEKNESQYKIKWYLSNMHIIPLPHMLYLEHCIIFYK